MTPQLWAIVGATGSGKTALSLDLAEQLQATGRQCEIINADAMQLYRGMDIGTAKLPQNERRELTHHMFDVLEPHEEASVAWYQPAVRSLVQQLNETDTDVILVGGSGLYVSSVLYDFQFPPRDEALRERIEAQLQSDGIEPLIEQLTKLAPETATQVDQRNPRRVVRALEIAILGQTAQVTLPEAPKLWCSSTRIIGVHAERSELVARLNTRVEHMWSGGMIDEVTSLIPNGIMEGKTASRAIGYAQALAQIAGTCNEAEAIAETQALTRRYARRQVSWFKRYPQIEWIDGPHLTHIGDRTTP